MNTPRVKICGLTNENDALELSKYDVSAFGFIVPEKKSLPSSIDTNLASEIISKLPSHILTVVGIAIDYPSPEEIIDICKKTNAEVVQIQVGGTLSGIRRIREKMPYLKIWKVFFTNVKPNLDKIANFEKVTDSILIHSREEEWKIGLRIKQVLKKPFILAGGLNLNNVKKAIKKFNPFYIDLIRGTETTPGKKDFNKVEKLIRLTRVT